MKPAKGKWAEWSLPSVHLGTVTQNDVPRLMKALLKEEFPSIISKNLLIPHDILKNYANGRQRMGDAVGKRFVDYLDARAAKLAEEKQKAASAGTETTQRSEDSEQKTSPEIVPQSQEEKKDMPEKKPYEPPAIIPAEADAAAALEEARAENALQQKQIETLEAMLDARQQKIVELQGRLQQAESGDGAQRCGELASQNENLRIAIDDLTHQAEKLQAEHVKDLELLRDVTRLLLKAEVPA